MEWSDEYIEHVKVVIANIKVGWKYYSFDYYLERNGNAVAKDTYESDHERSPQTMRKYLRNGGAVELVLEKYF